MANDTFTQKITLEGGDVINKQLKDLGEIGQQAFQKVQASAGPASKMLDQLQSTVSGLFGSFRELAKSFDAGFGKVVSDLGEATVAATKFGAGFGGIIAAASAVSAAVGHMGQAASDSIAKVNDLAEKAGLTLEKYQELKAGGEGIGLGGTDFAKAAETAKDTIEKLQLALGKGVRVDVSAEDQKTAPLSDLEKKYDVLNKLGVAIRDVDGALLGSGDIVDAFVAALAKIDVAGDDIASTAKRTAIATQFFGKAVGDAMVSASESLGKVNENMGAVSASGVKFSASQKETIDQARRTGVALGAVVSQWKDYVLALAAPVTVNQNNAVLKLFAENKEAIKSFIDDYVGPAVRWLGELQNTLGAAAIAAAALGLGFGAIGPVTAAALGIAGGAVIFFWDDVKKYASEGIAEVKRIISGNNLNSWDGWKHAAATAWGDISGYVAQAYQKIKSYALEAFPSLTGIWNDIERAFSGAWNYIVSQSKSGFPDLVAAWGQIKEAASFAWDVIVAGAGLAWAAIQKIMTVANEAAGVINGMFGTNFTGATLLATVLFLGLASSLDLIPGYIKVIALLLSPFAEGFLLLSGAVKAAGGAIDFILGKIQSLTDWLSDKLVEGLKMIAGPEIWGAMESAARNTLGFIQSAFDAVTTAARNAWAAIKGGGGTSIGAPSPAAAASPSGAVSKPTDEDYRNVQRSWVPGRRSDASPPDAPPSSQGGGGQEPLSAYKRWLKEYTLNFNNDNPEYHANPGREFPDATKLFTGKDDPELEKLLRMLPEITDPKKWDPSDDKPKKKHHEEDSLNLSGSLRSTTTAFDGLIGKIGQFAAALVAPGNGSGLQMPGLGGLAMPAMAMAPAFASNASYGGPSGQPNAGLIAFTLGINGQQEQVYATREVIDDLRRLAAAAQMSSTTKRSPSWDT